MSEESKAVLARCFPYCSIVGIMIYPPLSMQMGGEDDQGTGSGRLQAAQEGNFCKRA